MVDVVVVVVGTLRPTMSTLPQLQSAPFPGSVSTSLLHVPDLLLFQLVQVPASTMLSRGGETVHVTRVVNLKVVKRQVPPPPPVQGPVTAVPQGFVFWLYTSPQLSASPSQ